MELMTEQTRQLTFLEGKTDYNPVFTNDEKKVLFLSSRGNGIFSVDLNGGQVEQIVELPGLNFCSIC
jgi:Tol biopolymer transport system component